MAIGHLPNGTKGFDADFVIDTALAKNFLAAGYRFAVRYVGRVQAKPQDASSAELNRLLSVGLSVMLVQHVKSAESWDPQGAALGTVYGRNAALLARACGYAPGATLWCDLEGVAVGTPAGVIRLYCNAWYDAVLAGGYSPGLYVGWHAGLSGYELYWRLKMRRFWSAYNLDRDGYPAVRGVQMRQKVATDKDRVVGVEWVSAIDVNVIQADALGDSPLLMLAAGDR